MTIQRVHQRQCPLCGWGCKMTTPGKWECTKRGCDYGKHPEAAKRERAKRDADRTIKTLPEDRRILTPDEYRRQQVIAAKRREGQRRR